MGENLRSLDDSVVEGTTNLDERLVEASNRLRGWEDAGERRSRGRRLNLW